MAVVRPFRPLHYRFDGSAELSARIAPPYDVIDGALRATLASGDAHNVVALDLPEGEGDQKYQNAKQLLAAWRDAGELTRDEEYAIYTYEQRFTSPADGRPKRRSGFFAAVRLERYDNKVILPHERTLSGPKVDRKKLLEAAETALSPGFLLYRGNGEQAKLEAAATTVAEFRLGEGAAAIEHRFGRVTDPAVLAEVSASLADAQLLIADGHHRYETALGYAEERGETSATAASRYGLFYLVDENDPELLVLPTHRVVHSLAGLELETAWRALEGSFSLEELDPAAGIAELSARLSAAGQVRPSFIAAAGERRVLLTLRPEIEPSSLPGERPAELRTLDVVLLHDFIFEQLLGLSREAQAAKTNLRYVQDASIALQQAREGQDGAQISFLLNGTPPSDVRRMAVAGEVMPQKSTFFFPKVPTGLLFLPLTGEL